MAIAVMVLRMFATLEVEIESMTVWELCNAHESDSGS